MEWHWISNQYLWWFVESKFETKNIFKHILSLFFHFRKKIPGVCAVPLKYRVKIFLLNNITKLWNMFLCLYKIEYVLCQHTFWYLRFTKTNIKKSNSENEIQEIAQIEHTRNQVKTSTAANQTNAEMRTMNSNK